MDYREGVGSPVAIEGMLSPPRDLELELSFVKGPLADALNNQPDTHTYSVLLRGCADLKTLSDGRHIHVHIVMSGLEHNVFLGNLLMQMYSKCGSLEDACAMFDRMGEKNEFSWTIMIGAFTQHDQGKEALLLFQRSRLEGIDPDKVTCVTILSVCASQGSLTEGKSMHAYIVRKGIEHDVIVGNALVNMYGKSGRLEDARRMFDKLPKRNVISWNGMITAYAHHGKGREAMEIFKEMQAQGENPNSVTFVSILTACASQGDLMEAKKLHAYIASKGCELDGVMGNALINMYSKCGSVDDAWMMFDKMTKRNVVSWNAIIGAYAQHGQGDMAFSLFQQMKLEGLVPDKVTFISLLEACAQQALLDEGQQIHASIMDSGLESDMVVQTALLHMYSKCGSLNDARSQFDRMPERDVVSLNAMIAAYAEHSQSDEALKLFQQMQLEGEKPDTFTYVSILDACASQEALAEGKRIHARLMSSGSETNFVVETALLNMYGKCGSLEDAWRVFSKMSQQDVVPWNALIAAYAKHEQGRKALQLFQQMQVAGVLPDQGTFVSILDACGSLIAIEEGKAIHDLVVESGFEADVVVGTALVTMYGKCGSLEDAQLMFSKLPDRCVVLWTALITTYSQHGEAKKALQLFHEMKSEGEIPNKTTFTSVLSACSHSGLIDEGWAYFHSMSQDYGIEPTVDHHNCMIDLLGRGGHLKEAEDLILNMAFHPNATSWITLLSACKNYLDVERGKRAAERALELDPDNDAAYVLLSNMYAAAGRWEDVAKTRMKMEAGGVKKQPGCSTIKVNNQPSM